MQRDLYNNSESKIALAPIVLASDTDTVSVVIPTTNFNSGKVVLSAGVVTAGDITIKEIKESDDSVMAGETIVPAERLLGPLTTLGASGITELGFIGVKAFITVTFTTANSANLLASCNVELGHPDQAPTK